jgi:hypothetical protein
VRTLAERDVTGLLSVVAEIAVLEDVRLFPPDLLRRLGDLVGGADVFYCELDRLRQRSIVEASSEGDESDAPSEDKAREYFRLVNEHPVCSHRTRTDDWTSVLKVSDFSSQRDFERTEIWNELYRHDGVRYWMDVGIAPSGPRTRVFIFTRGDCDFDEHDRLVLDLLQPHLQQRYDQRFPTRIATALVALSAAVTLGGFLGYTVKTGTVGTGATHTVVVQSEPSQSGPGGTIGGPLN